MYVYNHASASLTTIPSVCNKIHKHAKCTDNKSASCTCRIFCSEQTKHIRYVIISIYSCTLNQAIHTLVHENRIMA